MELNVSPVSKIRTMESANASFVPSVYSATITTRLQVQALPLESPDLSDQRFNIGKHKCKCHKHSEKCCFFAIIVPFFSLMLQNIDSGVFSVLDRDDYLVRQTDDRLLVPADPAVMHTDLIRA